VEVVRRAQQKRREWVQHSVRQYIDLHNSQVRIRFFIEIVSIIDLTRSCFAVWITHYGDHDLPIPLSEITGNARWTPLSLHPRILSSSSREYVLPFPLPYLPLVTDSLFLSIDQISVLYSRFVSSPLSSPQPTSRLSQADHLLLIKTFLELLSMTLQSSIGNDLDALSWYSSKLWSKCLEVVEGSNRTLSLSLSLPISHDSIP